MTVGPASEGSEFDGIPKQWWLRLGHDLRAPIAPIRLAVQLLRSGHGTPAEQQAALRLMDRQIDQLLADIEDISELARLNAGTFAFRPVAADMNLVLDIVSGRSALGRTLEEKQQTLRCCPLASALAVNHDPARMVELLEFLVRKAAAHAVPGAVLTLELVETSDQVNLRVTGAEKSLAADPDLIHVTGSGPADVGELAAKALVMREIARLSNVSFSLDEHAAIGMTLPALR